MPQPGITARPGRELHRHFALQCVDEHWRAAIGHGDLAYVLQRDGCHRTGAAQESAQAPRYMIGSL